METYHMFGSSGHASSIKRLCDVGVVLPGLEGKRGVREVSKVLHQFQAEVLPKIPSSGSSFSRLCSRDPALLHSFACRPTGRP
jgi:hypothetical protein